MAKDFLSGYKTYDTTSGHGTPRDWKRKFARRMNIEEAQAAVGDNTPHGILGIEKDCAWEVVKTAYRKLARTWHPDVNAHRLDAATKRMSQINGAFRLLEEKYGK